MCTRTKVVVRDYFLVYIYNTINIGYHQGMHKSVARLKGAGFILWHARHHAAHLTVGIVWAWVLGKIWQQFSARTVIVSLLGSELPDVDHLLYIFLYGRKDWYAREIKKFLRNHEWRTAALFLSTQHKKNTSLMYHNYYFMLFLFILCIISTAINWRFGFVLFGAMIIHYCIDIFDDILVLGRINANWKRWGRPKKAVTA